MHKLREYTLLSRGADFRAMLGTSWANGFKTLLINVLVLKSVL